MKNLNYFEILEIEPTTDLNVVKKAFRTSMMINHPDKNGDAEKCKKVVEAWELLQEQSKLSEYYESVLSDVRTASPAFGSSEEKRERKQESPSDSLVPFGAMLTVFIPMFVQKPDFYSKYLIQDDRDLKTMRRDNMTAINPYRFKTPDFDFNALTDILNYVIETYNYKQIGLDIQDVRTIVNQHSWYKNYGAFFGVSVRVNIADITDRFSEADVSSAINAGTQAFLAIKKGTQIDVNNIIAIHMSGTDNTGMRLAEEHDFIIYKNPKPQNREKTSPESLLALLGPEEVIDNVLDSRTTTSSGNTSPLLRHGLFEGSTVPEEEEDHGFFKRCTRCTIM
jgi:hypothetical protein